jgi:hypothetical protein
VTDDARWRRAWRDHGRFVKAVIDEERVKRPGFAVTTEVIASAWWRRRVKAAKAAGRRDA